MSLKKKWRWIFGGSSGIGRACAEVMLRGGDHVVVFSRSPRSWMKGKKLTHIPMDFSNDASCKEALAKALQQKLFPQSVVFSQRYRSSGDEGLSEWGVVVIGTQKIMELMEQRGLRRDLRSVVMISSVAGSLVASEQTVDYHVAKAAMEALVRYYAVLWGKEGIRVNGIAPATVLKKESVLFYRKNKAALMEALSGEIPLGRMGTAEDVAQVAVLLMQPEASFLTGEVLRVDGGLGLIAQASIIEAVNKNGLKKGNK